MKKLIILFAMSLVVSAASANAACENKAVDENSTWTEIKGACNYFPSYPAIGMNGGNLVAISVDALCVDGDTVRPIKQNYQKCVKWDHEADCIESVPTYLSAPRAYTREVCTKWDQEADCVESHLEATIHPLVYKIDVYHLDRGFPIDHDAEREFVFAKTFEIPACK